MHSPYVATTTPLHDFEKKLSLSEKIFSSPRSSPTKFMRDDYFDDTASSDGGGKSSDEMDYGKVKTSRKNSIITFSNVKRKISSTFQKRSTSLANSPLASRKLDSPHSSMRSITSTDGKSDKNSDNERKKSEKFDKKTKRCASATTLKHHKGHLSEDSDLEKKNHLKKSLSTHAMRTHKTENNGRKSMTRRSSSTSMKSQNHENDKENQRRASTSALTNKKKNLVKHKSFDNSTVLQHPALERLRNSTVTYKPNSSIPDIQSRSRASSFRPMRKFSIYLLGSRAVGKTALTVRFLTGRYIHEYRSTPEEVYNRIVKYDDEQADVSIHAIDIETMEKDIELDCNSGIMILYSIIDEKTYSDASFLLHYLSETNITNRYPVMFIGTKRDLSRLRQVERKDASDLSNSYNCTQFEVSSATDKRVKDCFHSLFRQIEVRQLLEQSDDLESKPAILNPPRRTRNGIVRYGTA